MNRDLYDADFDKTMLAEQKIEAERALDKIALAKRPIGTSLTRGAREGDVEPRKA